MLWQASSIEDTVQKICQQIRDMHFDSVSDEQKKDCKKRNLIKEEWVLSSLMVLIDSLDNPLRQVFTSVSLIH